MLERGRILFLSISYALELVLLEVGAYQNEGSKSRK